MKRSLVDFNHVGEADRQRTRVSLRRDTSVTLDLAAVRPGVECFPPAAVVGFLFSVAVGWDGVTSGQVEARMQFRNAEDTEAVALREELAARTMDTDAVGLLTANLWLWTIETSDRISDSRAVVAALFSHPGLPCRELLEPRTSSAPWGTPDPAAARAAAMRLLITGTSMEIAAFHDEPRAAARFTARLFDWVGSPVAAFASMEYQSDGSGAGFGVFRLPHWVDEGLVLVGPERIGLLWFVGTD